MNFSKLPLQAMILVLFTTVIILLLSYLFPWRNINWGNLTYSYQKSVTVSGMSEKKEANQVASYSAGVSTYNDSKEKAIAEVNDKISAITKAVKDFGIAETDIQTQNLSIYQSQDYVYEGDRQKYKPGQWNVLNTVTINLKDVKRAFDLATLLAGSGATNVYGPSFSIEDTKEIEKSLLGEAINDARSKADIIARSSGKRLGEVLNVAEGGTSSPYPVLKADYGRMGGGGSVPVEPGSTNIQKTVTVTFELK